MFKLVSGDQKTTRLSQKAYTNHALLTSSQWLVLETWIDSKNNCDGLPTVLAVLAAVHFITIISVLMYNYLLACTVCISFCKQQQQKTYISWPDNHYYSYTNFRYSNIIIILLYNVEWMATIPLCFLSFKHT